jgi:hypothetical protein
MDRPGEMERLIERGEREGGGGRRRQRKRGRKKDKRSAIEREIKIKRQRD